MMQKYDAVLKLMLSHCRELVLEHFLGIDLTDSEVTEISQETTSIRRTDLPLMVRSKRLGDLIVLIELQTKWERVVPLRLLEYEARYKIDKGLKVIPLVIVLTRSPGVVDIYEDENITYRFRVVRIWEMDPREILEKGYVCLAPLTVLMKGGKDLLEEADNLILNSELKRAIKGDLLTGMTLLSGLVDERLPLRLLERRRDIMRESIAYDLIKEEGIKQGLEQGLQKGMLEDAREMVLEGLLERFKSVPRDVEDAINTIQSRTVLKELHRALFRVKNLEGFKKLLNKMITQ
ncbi:MAG: hypothetical protein QXS68_06090 [Candidatus Methanomethylicaceae archaeon]